MYLEVRNTLSRVFTEYTMDNNIDIEPVAGVAAKMLDHIHRPGRAKLNGQLP